MSTLDSLSQLWEVGIYSNIITVCDRCWSLMLGISTDFLITSAWLVKIRTRGLSLVTFSSCWSEIVVNEVCLLFVIEYIIVIIIGYFFVVVECLIVIIIGYFASFLILRIWLFWYSIVRRSSIICMWSFRLRNHVLQLSFCSLSYEWQKIFYLRNSRKWIQCAAS